MNKKRTPLNRFIKSSWTNMNIRAGKYRHLQTENKCKVYANVKILFTREEFKSWCILNSELILNLKRPSIDRIDSKKDYSLDNIQIIELLENIKRKINKGNTYLNGPKSKTLRGIRKYRNKFYARITIKGKETFLGSFDTKNLAYNAFREAYFKHYGKMPW